MKGDKEVVHLQFRTTVTTAGSQQCHIPAMETGVTQGDTGRNVMCKILKVAFPPWQGLSWSPSAQISLQALPELCRAFGERPEEREEKRPEISEM